MPLSPAARSERTSRASSARALPINWRARVASSRRSASERSAGSQPAARSASMRNVSPTASMPNLRRTASSTSASSSGVAPPDFGAASASTSSGRKPRSDRLQAVHGAHGVAHDAIDGEAHRGRSPEQPCGPGIEPGLGERARRERCRGPAGRRRRLVGEEHEHAMGRRDAGARRARDVELGRRPVARGNRLQRGGAASVLPRTAWCAVSATSASATASIASPSSSSTAAHRVNSGGCGLRCASYCA